MSASVAPPMAGLLNYDFGRDDMHEFTATDFPDHMELDRSPRPDDNLANPTSSATQAHERPSQSDANNVASTEEQTEALGNLLGALIPQQIEGSENGADFNAVGGASATQEQITTSEQPQEANRPTYDLSRLPSFDATAANELFSTEDFSQLGQDIDIPQTPNGYAMNGTGMTHFRQDSFASQGSAARRPATPQQREFEAFARLQFEDGSYYLNTYACELGRDVLAYRAALQKEREEKEAELNSHGKSRSSSGRASHRSGRMRRQLGSQMQGSVVSEQGGFAGIDEAPMRPPQNPEKPTVSSQESESSVVKPAEYLINPRTMPQFDYHRSTEIQAKWVAQEENDGEAPDDEQPAAVTSAHLPSPHMCPLIPIHGKPKDGQTDAELHKKISRRHVKIQWSFEKDCWEMKVQGRNGAFCDGMFVRWRGVVPLQDGAIIQIAHVVLTFRLPKPPQPQQTPQQEPQEVDADEVLPSVEAHSSETPTGDDRRGSTAEQKATPKISIKLTQKTETTPTELPVGPDGQPIMKRRGPGRPPKDGIMSTRERKEREKAAKMAAAREANGGQTPPPSMRAKLPKPTPPAVEEIKTEVKPEKRKYTKRKTVDEDGNPMPDADGEADEADANGEEPKSKKARAQREKSESPEYPPRESLTAEQLARPPESYATLLHKILMDLHPRALPLKDIYRELKKRYPWYVYEVQTEGWQSSIRHNLNSEYGKLFDKGDKEGKGFAWRAIPTAQVPQSDKKRTTQAPAQRPRPAPQRPQFQPLPGQSAQWQNTGPLPTNGGQQPFVIQSPYPQVGQAGYNLQQNGTPPAGTLQQTISPAPAGLTPQTSTHQPGVPQVQGQAPAGQGPRSSIPPTTTVPLPVASRSAASNMPCTLDGIEAINRFEKEMYKQLGADERNLEKKDFWVHVFASAKKRMLHGHQTSTHPRGDSREEATIMSHLENFVKRFKNPNFKGFTQRAPPTVAANEPMLQAPATPQTQAPPGNPSASTGSPPLGNDNAAAQAPQVPQAVPSEQHQPSEVEERQQDASEAPAEAVP